MDPCPWSSFSPSSSRFCEDALCSVVREPANTWSNVGFLAAGIAILVLDRGGAPRLVRRFGLVCIFLAFGSAIFHATGTWLGGLLDSAGMQGAAAFMAAANLRRVYPAPPGRAEQRDARAFWLLAVTGFVVVTIFERYERTIFTLEMIAIGLLEIRVIVRARLRRAHRWLAWSWAAFGLAYFAWWIDLRGAACNPSAHVVNGHAAWHLLMAASLFFLQRFHSELASGGLGFRGVRRGTRGESVSPSPARSRA